jgi:carboxymethylenebutenolidase
VRDVLSSELRRDPVTRSEYRDGRIALEYTGLATLSLAAAQLLEQFEEIGMPTTKPEGYLAVPPTDKGSPVLVLHAWWGLNDTMKALCTRLAESGFVAFAPDLYHGKIADNVDEAQSLATGLDSKQAKADITDATRFLNERAGQADRGIAVIGFSLGAYYALGLSVEDPEHIRSVVIFYGTGPTDFGRSKAAYLGHFAEEDEYEPLPEVEKLEAALRSAGRPVTFHRYPGTGHWFFEADRKQAFNQAAASLAWDRTLAFLKDSPTA